MNSLPLTLKRIFCDRYNIGMIIFLCLPLLNFFLLSNKVITLFYDGYAYLLIAESLYSGQGIKIGDITHVFYPPGFPFFIAFFKLFIHNSIMAAQFLCAVLSDINILMMFYLCKKYFNSKFIGLLAALIYLPHQKNLWVKLGSGKSPSV